MQFEDFGTGGGLRRLVAYALAGLAGAGAVGLVLLVAGLVGYRRRRALMPPT